MVPDADALAAEGFKIIKLKGSFYVGQVDEESQPHGYGYMTFNGPNNNQHEGQWEHGKANGSGTYIMNNGSVYEGTWENNLRVGEFIVTKVDGSQFREKYSTKEEKKGKLVARKKLETTGEKAVECWRCHGQFRESFNNAYGCQFHRGTWKRAPGQ